jgi:DNA-binding NarL/FixJ family response regulator
MRLNEDIKILIVGDYPLLRVGLRLLIEKRSKFMVVGEAADLSEIQRIAEQLKPQVIVTNSDELDANDFSALLLSSLKKIPVLVLAETDDPTTQRKYLKIGASGLVSKTKNADVLIKAIKKIHDKELWFSRRVMGQIVKELLGEKIKKAARKRSSLERTLQAVSRH